MCSKAIIVCLTMMVTSCLSMPEAEIGEHLADSSSLLDSCAPALKRYDQLVHGTVLEDFYLGLEMQTVKDALLAGAQTDVDSFDVDGSPDKVSCITYNAFNTFSGMLCHQQQIQISYEISAMRDGYRITFEAFGDSEFVDQIKITLDTETPTSFDVYAQFTNSLDGLQSCSYLADDQCVYQYEIKEGYAVVDETPLCPKSD